MFLSVQRGGSLVNEKQFKVNTKFIATRNVKEYRATIPLWVDRDDVVLELGCGWGVTTARIAEHCKEVIGTDISSECIDRARKTHPGIRFEVLDAFDVRRASEFDKVFTKVFIDLSGLSGYRSLLDVIALLQTYATILRPKAIIVKSGGLKHFATHCIPWHNQEGEVKTS